MEAHPTLNIMFVPEFLREGTAVDDFFSPPKAVIGYSRKDGLDQVVKVFSDTSDNLEFTGLREAESIKYVDNSWHAVKVAFTNEVSKILSAESCDAREVMRIFRTDTKLNLSGYYMKPGFAYGGSCLPKDLMALRHIGSKNKLDSPLLDAVDKSNKSIINYCLREIENRQPKSVLVSGITFKRDTDDLRNSPIIPVIKALLSKDIDVAFVDENIVQSRLFGDNNELYDSLILSGATHLNAVAQKYDIHVLHQWQNATAELGVDIDLTTDSKSPNFIFNSSS
jgi:GDP-mannose 6-dehydrogenase